MSAPPKTLTKATRCACCDEMMAPGEPFRWHLKAGRQVSKHFATQDRHRPAHVNAACYYEKMQAREAEMDRAQMAKTRAILIEAVGANPSPEMLALIDQATKAANHASFEKAEKS